VFSLNDWWALASDSMEVLALKQYPPMTLRLSLCRNGCVEKRKTRCEIV
jgi:hypothetical protein